MAPSSIPLLESERPIGSFRFLAPHQPSHGQSKGGKFPNTVGGQRQGAAVLWRSSSLPLHHGVKYGHALVGRGGGMHPYELGSSSSVVPADNWILRSADVQSHCNVIESGRCEDGHGKHVQQPLASSPAMEMLFEERILTSEVVAQKRRLHGYEERSFFPCMETMVVQLPGWTSSGCLGQRGPTRDLEKLPESWKREGSETHIKPQLVPEGLVNDFHKQTFVNVVVPPPNISETFYHPGQLGDHCTIEKHNEMRVPKGLHHNIDISIAMEATKGAFHKSAGSTKLNKKKRLYVCDNCGKEFTNGRALGGHKRHPCSGQRQVGKRNGGKPSTWVAGASIHDSIAPHTFIFPNQEDEVRPLLTAGTPLNGIPRGGFRLFGTNIIETSKEKPME
uniref:C2H2-type domain-containing protein n=1 Tax=Leersia perrieri TaxID=77586 RepID=A0A0D9XBB3_9ORYZ